MLKLLRLSAYGISSTSPHTPPPLTAPALPVRNATSVDSSEISSLLLTNARFVHQYKIIVEDNLILTYESFAAQAHVAPQGETRERFEAVAPKVNECRKFSFTETRKSAQDGYKMVQARVNEAERLEAMMSCFGGEE